MEQRRGKTHQQGQPNEERREKKNTHSNDSLKKRGEKKTEQGPAQMALVISQEHGFKS